MIYSYVLVRDYGFAPNPFPPACTLATCKPAIRYSAKVGDWVIGFGSARKGSAFANKLIYAMKIDEKCTFDEYYDNPLYRYKKPIMNGSLVQKYGDNIYHRDSNGNWLQDNSHHKNKDGTVNYQNLERDTKRINVLISHCYWYYGKDAISIPNEFTEVIHHGIGHKATFNETLENGFYCWLQSKPESGYIGKPEKFSSGFEYYNGT